ncbi:MAG TPA: hypothetical protein VKN73_07730 [Desulfosalsimonadaceae bacterium]|nr:hypothetical protein [Desulfosalsimonadaceae bacterium]
MPETQDPANPEYIHIAPIENAIEGQLMGSILTDQNIPHRIRSFHDTAYDGLYQFQKGWGEIWAPEKYRASILDILEKIRSDTALSE